MGMSETYKWITCAIFVSIGLFFIIATIMADRAGRSGVPFVGSIFICIGFLLSPVKLLALLALLDPGFLMIPYAFYENHHIEKMRKKFDAEIIERGYKDQLKDISHTLIVRVKEINDELDKGCYVTNFMYNLRIPKVFFAICEDADGNRFLLVDEGGKDNRIDAFPFDYNTVSLTGLGKKTAHLTVELEIINTTKDSLAGRLYK